MAQVDAQSFLRLCEEAGRIAFVDIEATGLGTDYNSVLLVSIKPGLDAKPEQRRVQRPGMDRQLVRDVRDRLTDFDLWVTYYGKGYDMPFLIGRLTFWGLATLPIRHHLDLYFVGNQLHTSRRSQGHLLSHLYPNKKADSKIHRKMTLSAAVWNQVLDERTRTKALATLGRRCDSDVEGLASLYRRIKHLAREVTR